MTLVDKILLWVITIEACLFVGLAVLLFIEKWNYKKPITKIRYPSYDTTINIHSDKDKT